MAQSNAIQYQVVNRFQCPFEGNAACGEDTLFDVNTLFKLQKQTFAVEFSN
jgi:hypothetical protein